MDSQSTSEAQSIINLVKELKEQRDWVKEVRNLACLMDKLVTLDDTMSVRKVAKLLDKSKSWIGVSLILSKGLKLYPEIEKCRCRNEAYSFLQRKSRLKRFLES